MWALNSGVTSLWTCDFLSLICKMGMSVLPIMIPRKLPAPFWLQSRSATAKANVDIQAFPSLYQSQAFQSFQALLPPAHAHVESRNVAICLCAICLHLLCGHSDILGRILRQYHNTVSHWWVKYYVYATLVTLSNIQVIHLFYSTCIKHLLCAVLVLWRQKDYA